MTREIKFRGYSEDPQDWFFGSYLVDTKGHYICDMDGFEAMVKPETVGQYTGLKDENGKEIYEGDIVEHYDFEDGSLKLRVGWHQGTYNMVAYYGSGENDYITMEEIEHEHEVIGNIHQNPELL